MNLEDAKEKKEKELASYKEYECKDYHLTALKKGDKLASALYDNDIGIYWGVHQMIEDISKDEFVATEVIPPGIGPTGEKYVFQSPNNKVNVLEDWNIRHVEVCYWLDSENPDRQHDADNGELLCHTLYASDDKELIAQLKNLLLKTNKESKFRLPENYQNMQRNAPEYMKLFLRFTFEETESIAWDCELQLYQSIDEPSEYSVTLENGMLKGVYDMDAYEVEVVGADQFCRELVEKFSEEFIN